MPYTVPKVVEVAVAQVVTGATTTIVPTSATHWPVGAEGILVTRIRVKITTAIATNPTSIHLWHGRTDMGNIVVPVCAVGTIIEGKLTTPARVVGVTDDIRTRSTAYAVGDIVRASAGSGVDVAYGTAATPAVGFGSLWKCVTAGTSDTDADLTPVDTLGTDIADTGTVVWRVIGPDPGAFVLTIVHPGSAPSGGNVTVELIGSVIPQ